MITNQKIPSNLYSILEDCKCYDVICSPIHFVIKVLYKYLPVMEVKKKRVQASLLETIRIIASNFDGAYLEFSFRYMVDKYIKHLITCRMSHEHFGTLLSSSDERSIHASVQRWY